MDSISPLAKILAEANGIDWRSIPGSGDGGSVVEQDILNYLSRIMSGDEEPPATPVDEAPPGWTGEMPPMPTVAAGGLQALSAAGVESDITDFVAQQAHVVPTALAETALAETAPAETAPAEHTPGLMGDVAEPLAAIQPTQAADFHAPEFDASEFEMDEEPEQAAATQHPEPVQADAAPMQAAESEFELDDQDESGAVASSEGISTEGISSEEILTPSDTTPFGSSVHAEAEQVEVSQEPAAHAPMLLEAEAQQTDHEPVEAMSGALPQTDAQSSSVAAQMLNPEPAVVAAAAGGFGLGGFLSRLYGGKAKQDETHAETHTETPADAATPEAAQPEPGHAEQPAPQEPEPTIGAAHDLPTLDLPERAEPVLGEPLTPQAPPIPDTPVAAPLVADQWRDQEAAGLSGEAEPEVAAQPEQAAEHHPEQTDAEPSAAEPSAAESAAAEPAQVAQIDYSQTDLGQPIALPEAHEDASGLGIAAGAVAGAGFAAAGVATFAAADPAAPTAAAPTAANAITLRLNVDLSALELARAQVSEALFRDVPITLLVARAAARSLGTLGLHESGGLHGSGHVALANHAGQPLSADPSGDLRASLDGLNQVSEVRPALTVLDAAELGLDELHRGECSLSVGRMAGGGSALSLRGDIDPARGAQFLHEVEGLLQTPIKLLF
jgi:e3 binding domain